MVVSWLMVVAVVITYLLLFRFYIYPITFTSGLLFMFIGLLLAGSPLWAQVYFFGAIELLMVGYRWGMRGGRQWPQTEERAFSGKLSKRSNHPSVDFYAFAWLSVIYIGLVIYHFAVSGIPILGNTEIARFDFTSSGLLGLPGRTYLYGLPFLFVFVFTYDAMVTNKHSHFRSLLYLVLAMLAISGFMGGFKSGLLGVVNNVVLIYVVVYHPANLLHLINKFFYWVVPSVLYAVWVTTKLASIMGTYSSIGKYFSDRIFVISAQPSVYIFGNALFKGYGRYFLNDIAYFIPKYFHLFQPSGFPTNKVISSSIYHVPLSNSSFIVPVTLSGISEVYLNCGIIVSLFLMLLLGYVFGKLYFASLKDSSYLRIGSLIIAQMAFLEFITKGDLMYIILNYSLILALTLLLYSFFNLTLRSIAQVQHAARDLLTK